LHVGFTPNFGRMVATQRTDASGPAGDIFPGCLEYPELDHRPRRGGVLSLATVQCA
jgi:hypothetical protein